jgi:hypothetical protein
MCVAQIRGRSSFQIGGIVSVWISTVLILTSLPVALRVGPVEDTWVVVLITGIVVDRLMDLSNELTGLATNPCKPLAGSGVGAEELIS